VAVIIIVNIKKKTQIQKQVAAAAQATTSHFSFLGWPKDFRSDPKEPPGACLDSHLRLNPLKCIQNQQVQKKNGEGSEEKAPAD